MDLSRISARVIGSSKGFLKQNGPTILTGVGIAGFAATTVLVGRAALKSRGLVKDNKELVDVIANRTITDTYTKKDMAKEAGVVYIETGTVLLKIYGPAIVVGSASVFCILAAHGMMLKRQASLVAAYGVLDAGFKAYRSRVQEELGETKELELYRGINRVQSVDEAGEPCEIIDYNDVVPSPYSRFFDESSVNWTNTPEYNLVFLRQQQQWANDRLRAYGYLFLNEVYQALGLERSQAGQVVGWKSNTENGDGWVSFGLYDISDECNRAFVNGLEHTVLLDFNVDGPIKI